jgi:putative ABC transport system substrate-binding protein
MRRREFITLLGTAAAWPVTARAQPATEIGFLGAGTQSRYPALLESFRQSLADAGYIKHRNLAIEYRFAEGRYDQLPAMATDLVRRHVAVIVATPTPAALAAKAATTSLPIVFNAPDDPIKLGLVRGIARPGGNATGVSTLLSELSAKQLGLLRELLPSASRFGLLVNPNNQNAEVITNDVRSAAVAIGVEISIAQASDSSDIELAFAALVRDKVNALLVGTDPFFVQRRVQLTTLATRHALPAIYNVREYIETGGLMSYGTSQTEAFRQMATYTARILNGEKPADLPVVQSIKFDFAINLPTARALGITVPPMLLARADEVIE